MGRTTAAPEHLNQIRLVGRVSADPEARVLPSGDALWTMRVVVQRPPGARASGGRPGAVDVLDCAAWTPTAQRTVSRWSAGDVVEVEGAVRRRFFRAGGAAASRVEIEIASGRRLSRAPAG